MSDRDFFQYLMSEGVPHADCETLKGTIEQVILKHFFITLYPL